MSTVTETDGRESQELAYFLIEESVPQRTAEEIALESAKSSAIELVGDTEQQTEYVLSDAKQVAHKAQDRYGSSLNLSEMFGDYKNEGQLFVEQTIATEKGDRKIVYPIVIYEVNSTADTNNQNKFVGIVSPAGAVHRVVIDRPQLTGGDYGYGISKIVSIEAACEALPTGERFKLPGIESTKTLDPSVPVPGKDKTSSSFSLQSLSARFMLGNDMRVSSDRAVELIEGAKTTEAVSLSQIASKNKSVRSLADTLAATKIAVSQSKSK